jgi:starch-binding outer membrane protein, SusD/RagB family
MAEINFYKSFPEGPRKNVTFQTDIWIPADKSVASAFYNTRSASWWIDVPWYDSRTYKQHPYYAKQRLGGSRGGSPSWNDRYLTGTLWRSGRSQRIIRYAEVLLVYAEAQCMANGGPDASAYTAINRIRVRAGLNNLSSGMNALQFQEACFNERGWEFAGNEYCNRWADLLRFEKVEKANSNRDLREYALNHNPTKSDYFMPIPASEKNKDPN